MKSLNVFFEDKLVGFFKRDRDLVHSFKYSREWIQSEKSFPISISMPLSDKEFGNKLTLAFFENLLPEGNVRAILEKWHHSEGAFNTLSKYGGDCAGALVITTKDIAPKQSSSETNVQIELSQIYKSINESKSVVDLIADKNPGYLSIAGAQDKFPCIFKDNKIYLPKGGHPTTHIVKTPILVKGIKESVYNEYFSMKLAKEIGLNVPEVDIIDGEHPLFLIKRYDRETLNNQPARLHQQDFCQAFGVLSSEKYEEEGGPSFSENYSLMVDNVSAQDKLESIFRLIDWLCFNLLIGNNDSHSKNISFLMVGRKYRLAPFYDLLSTAIYPNLESKFSFKIGNENKLEKIGINAFKIEEKKLGIKEGTIIDRMNLIYGKVKENQETIIKDMNQNFPKSKIQIRIKELITKRAKHFKRAGLKI